MKRVLTLLLALFSIILFLGIIAYAEASTYGNFEFGASKSSEGIEAYSTNLEVELQNKNIGGEFAFYFQKEQVEDIVQDMTVNSHAQGNYYFGKPFMFANFSYARDINSGIDDKTSVGSGAGYKNHFGKEGMLTYFAMQSGVYITSTYAEIICNRDTKLKSTAIIEQPLGGPFALIVKADHEAPFEKPRDYILETDSSLITKLDQNLYLKFGLKYKHYERPIKGQMDESEWGVKMGVRF